MSNLPKENLADIRVAGKTRHVPSAAIFSQTVVLMGKWLRIATLKDEELIEGQPVKDPAEFIEQLRKSPLRADVLSFAQKIPDTTPQYDYPFEWDNWAIVPITSFADWWEKRLPQESRKNARRASKRGVVVKVVPFDDNLVRGIQAIYNETPTRQGRPFWHYGKDLETVKRENATYLDRSEFIGAYLNEELIGFIKIVYVDRVATLIQILSKTAHQDKGLMNAMLASTVELCVKRRVLFLIYGKYTYSPKANSSLTEFKRRNGFEEFKYPRYFLPLTTKGRLAIRFGLHLGTAHLIPAPVMSLLLNLRSRVYRLRFRSMQPERRKEPSLVGLD